MSLKVMGLAAGLVLAATGFSTQASAGVSDRGVGLHGVPTSWARMTRHRSKVYRRSRMNKGAGTASSSAPNGQGTGMGPTGQPSGVK